MTIGYDNFAITATTSDQTLFTATTTTIVVMAQATNITTSTSGAVTLSFSDGTTTTPIAFEIPVNPGSAVGLLDNRFVLLAGHSLLGKATVGATISIVGAVSELS